MSETDFFEMAKQASRSLQDRFGSAPEIAVVLGSGLSGFAKELSSPQSVKFSEIPGGLSSSVIGHDGRFVSGLIGKKKTFVLAGRVHGYEGHSPQEVVHLVRSVRLWGCKKFIITNATGSTSLKFRPGQLALIKDQLNFTFRSPLTGKELYGGERFADQSDLYSKQWRSTALKVAKKMKVPLKEAVYVGVPGPSFETAAEIAMYRKLGGDICGMSTVWETMALNQMGTQILGVSCVTNLGTGVSKKPLNHEEVLEMTQKAQSSFNKLMKAIIEAA